jgi:hypothetical protein
VNSPPPKPEVILTNFFAEPTVLLVPITSREWPKEKVQKDKQGSTKHIQQEMCASQNMPVYINYQTV